MTGPWNTSRAASAAVLRRTAGIWLPAGFAPWQPPRRKRGSLPGHGTTGRVSWRLTRSAEAFAAIENAFDEEIDTGKTPIRTIGAPRMARAGIALRF